MEQTAQTIREMLIAVISKKFHYANFAFNGDSLQVNLLLGSKKICIEDTNWQAVINRLKMTASVS